ncbi:N-alpha-acetyltransferase 30 [Eumeta japonica]|uniref:N-terminal methionine N(alpha)-acetyltransferase NatC n=1 Tax=Eumeta variegata TaxID=151549 RepID=A0A4C1T682_EUMVA|nr:N-alpha-acetyltransferase 30 [Eumeta japonica]
MSQLVEDNIDNMKCAQKSTIAKTMKAKDHPEPTTDILNEDQLSDTLSHTLHFSNINSNLTNGTSDHAEYEDNSNASFESNISYEPHDLAHNDDAHFVNNVQYCKNEEKISNVEPSCSSEIDLIRNPVNNTDNSKTGLNLQEKEIEIVSYESELQMPEIMRLIQKDLSEPYSIYTYRYFIHNWPKLCFLARYENKCIGAIVCKLDLHRNVVKRGYIAMLAVDEKYRKRKIGSRLVRKAIQVMIQDNADEVVLETEITNKPALKLYENLGFVRDKRLFRYYLNGVDALRLKLWLR